MRSCQTQIEDKFPGIAGSGDGMICKLLTGQAFVNAGNLFRNGRDYLAGACSLCRFPNDLFDALRLRIDDDGAVLFDNPCFLAGDFLAGISEIFRMLEADARDNRRFGTRNDICRVEPSAESDLENADVTAGFLKIQQRDSRLDFKAGRLRFALSLKLCACCLNPVRKLDQNRIRYRLFVDSDAFVEEFKSRRHIGSGLKAGLNEDLRKHRRDGAFAVGPCDVYVFKVPLGVSKLVQQQTDRFKPETHPPFSAAGYKRFSF